MAARNVERIIWSISMKGCGVHSGVPCHPGPRTAMTLPRVGRPLVGNGCSATPSGRLPITASGR